MTEEEKIVRDIQTLRESIQLAANELFISVTPAGKQSVRVQIDLLQKELLELLVRLDESDQSVES